MASEHAGPTSLAAYQLLDEIGRGGMGVVHRARDLRLHREVAVKLLLADGPGDTPAADRFRAEAHITGQLQHPGIPAVHELGSMPDGRPFLAMKLVEGRTLQDLLKDRPDPGHDRGRFLAVFEQLCQAVGYAHAHGVIHRDLKPANVMVGAFGEVQVMDWGLAKRLASGGQPEPAAAEDPAVTEAYVPQDALANEDPAVTGAHVPFDTPEEDGSATRTGTVLGTPAYMPPEQAGGEIRKLDARSDVFGLGAIFCQVPTGRPPYAGGNAKDLRIRAVRGETAEALAALDASQAEPALVALCKQCLAIRQEERPADGAAVAQQVAGVRQAADERARQAELDRVKAEGEKAAAELKAAEQRKRRRVQAALGLAFTALLVLGGAFAWWQDRQAAGREAERTERQSRASAAMAANIREARERGAEAWVLFDFPDRMQVATDAALAAVGRAEQFAADGELTGEGTADLQAARAEVDDLARHTRLMVEVNRPRNETAVNNDNTNLIDQHHAALRQFGFDPLTDPESEVARRVESSRIRDGLLGILLEMRYHIRLVPTERRGHCELVVRAVMLHLGGSYARWQGLLDRNDVPGLVAFARSPEPLEFGAWVLARLGTDLQTAKQHDAARDLWLAAIARYPHEAWLRFNLVLASLNKNPPALHEALHHAAAAVTLQPGSPAMNRLLGVAYERLGDLDRAIVWYREAIRLNPKFATARRELCFTLRQKGDLDGALVAAREFVRVLPENGYAHTQLGWTHHVRKEYDQAAACYAEVVRLMPDNAQSWNQYGQILRAKRNPDEALTAFRQAVKLEPGNAVWHDWVALLLLEKNDPKGALVAATEAVRLDPKLALAQRNLGRARDGTGDLAGAVAAFREAVRLDSDSAWDRGLLAFALYRKNELNEALAECEEAIRLGPKVPAARNTLGLILQQQGDLDRAIAAFRESIRLDPTYVFPRGHLALALRQKGDLALRQKGDLDGAIAAWKEACQLDPKNAAVHSALAWVLSTGPDRVRDAKQAVEHATRACELTNWKMLNYTDTLAAAYAATGEFDKAVEYQKKSLSVPAYEKTFGPALRERLDLYTRKKPYYAPEFAPRAVAPPPREVKRP